MTFEEEQMATVWRREMCRRNQSGEIPEDHDGHRRDRVYRELMVRTTRPWKPAGWRKERSENPKGEQLRTDHCPNPGDGGQNFLDMRKEQLTLRSQGL